MNMSNHTTGKKKNNDPKPIKDEPLRDTPSVPKKSVILFMNLDTCLSRFIARMTPFWGWKM